MNEIFDLFQTYFLKKYKSVIPILDDFSLQTLIYMEFMKLLYLSKNGDIDE